jgi:hypothetical protein
MKHKTTAINKQFNPDYEHHFWCWRHKFEMVLEMIALLIGYDFMDGEIEGMLYELATTDSDSVDKWTGGLHYGKKDVVYMKFAQDIENKEIIHVVISTHKVLKERIEFIDLLQAHYKWFQK